MHSNAWARLLQQIPPQLQEQLMVVTAAGIEIAVNSIVRVDHEFVAFKGRLSGSQDQGRLFFLPFQNIDYVGFYREVKDEQYQEHFGNLQVPPPPQLAVTAAAQAEPPPQQELVQPEPEQAPPPEPETVPEPEPELAPQAEAPPVAPSAALPQRGQAAIKSAILERFRSRSGQGTNLRPNGEG
jgi:hypothetical protein